MHRRSTSGAPAKVNLCLFLGGTRADGRHELVTVFESVSLADELVLETLARSGTDRSSAPASPARTWSPMRSLTLRAVAAGERRRCRSRSTSGSRSRPAWGAGRPTPPRCCARRAGSPRSRRPQCSRSPPSSAPTSQPARSRARARHRRRRDRRARCPARRPRVAGAAAAVRPLDRGRLRGGRLARSRAGRPDLDARRAELECSLVAEIAAARRSARQRSRAGGRVARARGRAARCSAAVEAGAEHAIVCGSGPTVVGIWWGLDAVARVDQARDRIAAQFPGAICVQPVPRAEA